MMLEISGLRSKIIDLEMLVESTKAHLQMNEKVWKDEKESIRKDTEERIHAMVQEREQLLSALDVESRNKLMNITRRFDKSVYDLESTVEARVRIAVEAEILQHTTAMQRQCTKDIELARAEEKRLAAVEVENVKKVFLDREKQTMDDVRQLQSLHSDRVLRLEKQVEEYRKATHVAEDRVMKLQEELAKNISMVHERQENQTVSLKEYALRAEKLSDELKAAHQEIMMSKSKEMTYREQLATTLEECRMQRAELIEVKQNLTSTNAQLYRWKRAYEDSNVHTAAMQAEINIAKEEIAMLENELERSQEENNRLMKAVNKADDMIYGRGLTTPTVATAIRSVEPNYEQKQTQQTPSEAPLCKRYTRSLAGTPTSIACGTKSNSKSASKAVLPLKSKSAGNLPQTRRLKSVYEHTNGIGYLAARKRSLK